jgi:PhzF family phenazine biosynthesis protein
MNYFFQVDAFASAPFHGNTAGVVILKSGLEPEVMQIMATQNNLPATAFVLPVNSGFAISWYTPKRELALCGHATLASAHVLFELGMVRPENRIHFTTGRGDVWAGWQEDWTTIDFPAYGYQPAEIPAGLKSLFPKEFVSGYNTQDKWLIELSDETAVRNYVPDFQLLAPYKCILTARCHAGSSYDFVSRFFDGPDGIPEDAVTGSSHCCLAPFWSERLAKNKMCAFQASPRGGELKLQAGGQRVLISGQAVTIIEGKMMI